MKWDIYTPFTRSSKHRTNMKHKYSIAYTKQISSKHQANIEQTSSWLVQLTRASSSSQLVEPASSCKRGIRLRA